MPTNKSNSASSSEKEIAIIGMGCRFPGGADSPEHFWALLSRGESAVVDVPKARWNADRFYDKDPDKPGKMYVNRGGFLQEPIDCFDNQFFGISPREAANYDPQQRLLLEVSWEAMENAGIDPDSLRGSDTGVYVGGFMLDNYLTQTNPFTHHTVGPHTATSFTMTMLANRMSYIYDFHGPSFCLDTACSSSLVAVHQACRGIQNDECSLAIAGGVNVMHRPETYIIMCKGQMLASDGCSKSFDERADGYGRGEGAGIVILKALSQAIADKDPILSVIKATGVNQDGQTQGITVPNPEAQKALIVKVCHDAGIEPNQLSYIEAHGTGTAVGDPLETTAIGQTIGAGRQDDPVIIGSLKACVGHMEAAAGVASVIKATLCLVNNQVPPQANLINPNPKIDFAGLGLKLPRQAEVLPQYDGQSYVGINCFGYGGTNAFALLRKPTEQELAQAQPEQKVAQTQPMPHILPLSARDPEALKAHAEQIRDLMQSSDAPALDDLLWTLAHSRTHHNYRMSVYGDDSEQVQQQLDELLAEDSVAFDNLKPLNPDVKAKTLFVFSGMGPQWWKMGQELYHSQPLYREWVKRCDEVFQPIAGWSIEAQMLRPEAESQMSETDIAQPANFVLQAGIALLYRARGIEAHGFVGHSVGEVSSAYMAGALSLEDALLVSYHRSRIQKKAAGIGGMLAVGLSEADVQSYLAPFRREVSIAAVNGPTSVTLAGASHGLERIAEQLTDKGIFNRELRVEVAYHSPTMEPLHDELIESLAPLNPSIPDKPLYSTVDGKPVTGIAYDNHYWYKNVRQQVSFRQAMEQAIDDGYNLFVEIGPHPVLSQNIKECLQVAQAKGSVIHSLNRKVPEIESLMAAIGQYYAAGGAIDFDTLYPCGKRIALPNYPWQRVTLWNESDASIDFRLAPVNHPLLQYRVSTPEIAYESRVNANYQNYVYDHRLNHLAVMPGAGYIEMALAFVAEHLGEQESQPIRILEQFEFKNALMVDDSDEPRARISYDELSGRFQIHSSSDKKADKWTLHAQGVISQAVAQPSIDIDRQALELRCTTHVTATDFYQMLAERGQHYGPYFQCVTDLKYNADEVFATLEIADDLDTEHYTLHPTLLDSAFQTFLVLLTDNVYMPVHIDRLNVLGIPTGPVWAHASVIDRDPYHAKGDLQIFDEQGNLLVDIKGLVCQALNSQKEGEQLARLSYALQWEKLAMSPGEIVIEPQHWLVLVDDNPFSYDLSVELCQVLEEQPGSSVLQVQGSAGVDQLQGLSDMVRQAANKGCDHILYLWDLHNNEDPIGFDRSVHLLNLLKALAAQNSDMKLTVITQGGQMVHPDQDYLSLSQAATIGLARVAANEFPQLSVCLIDLDKGPVDHQQLLHVLFEPSGNNEIALRGDEVYVSRLHKDPLALPDYQRRPVMAGDKVQLEVGTDRHGGKIDFRKTAQRAAGEDEITIEFKAINLPMAGRNNDWFEGCGEVVALGEQVENIELGDTLAGYFKGQAGFNLTLNINDMCAVKKPGDIGDREIVQSLPTYVSASYALSKLDSAKACNRVLVHQADSHFGCAAVNLALHAGYEVYVTIDDPALSQSLLDKGVRQVFSARTQDFIDQLSLLKNQQQLGEGIDLILNTLSGELRQKSFALLAPSAHFIEVAPLAEGDLGAIPLSLLAKNISVTLLDTQALLGAQSARFLAISQKVTDLIAQGDLPLLTLPSYELSQLQDNTEQAFESDVITVVKDQGQVPWVLPVKSEQAVRADGCYLVTGGLGGFGLASAHALVKQGATHLVLVSRSGAASQEAQKGVASLEAEGCKVLAIAADISDEQSVVAMMAQLHQAQAQGEWPALRGIIHSAAVLDDDHLVNLDAERMRKVMLPKAKGAWLLHRHTLEEPLDFFVLYSSISSLIGNLKQGNYVAANTFLDHLAHYRQQRGLPATTVNWGAIGSVGMAARNSQTELFLEKMGIYSLAPKLALNQLFDVLKEPPVQMALMDVDWNKWALFQPGNQISLRFKHLVEQQGSEDSGDNSRIAQLLAMPSKDEQIESILTQFVDIVSETLSLPVERINREASLISMGVDSLLSMEFQSKIKAAIGVSVSVLALLTSDSLVEIAESILSAVIEEGSSESEVAQLVTPMLRENGQAELSFAQQRLWFIDQLQGGSAEYNIPAVFLIEGAFDVDIAEAAVRRIIERHETLRTIFVTEGGQAIQQVRDDFEFTIERHDLSHQEPALQQSTARALITNDNLKTFDLSADLMIRMSYLVLSDGSEAPQKGIALFNMHHIAADAWSIGVFLNEFVSHYEAIRQQGPDPLSPLAVQYADYAQWQRQWLTGDKLDAQLSYWTAQLADAPACHSLPLDFPRPQMKDHRGELITSALPAPLSQELLQIAKDNELTTFMLLHGALSLLFSRHSNQHDICIGTSMANRAQQELEPMIGFFVNTQVLRVDTRHDSLDEFFAHVRTVNLEAQAHQDIPFELLVEHCKVPRSTQHGPLFQILFTTNNLDENDLSLPGVTFTAMEGTEIVAKFDLEINYRLSEQGLEFIWVYDTTLFTKAHVETLAEHLNRLLAGIAEAPQSRLLDLPMLSQDESEQLVEGLNQAPVSYPQPLLHQLFEQQADATPQGAALVSQLSGFGTNCLSYQQLNQAANRLAHYLADKGVGPQSLVGICLDRSPKMLIALLAVLKAGAAYVPLDPSHPSARLDYIVEDTGLKHLLTQGELADGLSLDESVQKLKLDELAIALSEYPQSNPPSVAIDDGALAYVIYTSGSTGKPKGVMVEHRAMVNFLQAMNDSVGKRFAAPNKWLAVTTVAFDIAGLELFGPLCHGGQVVLASKEDALSAERIAELLSEHQIDGMQATPATWAMLMASNWAGRENLIALSGGEALPTTLAAQLLGRTAELWNCYGPTEATVWSMVYRVDAADVERSDAANRGLSLRQGLANYRHYVLDEHQQLVPAGCVGELCIAGRSLARGYLNREELTAAQFVDVTLPGQPAQRLYRTGDLVRLLSGEQGAEVEYIGRLDDQVKIRGFRIELGEIESQLRACDTVEGALVLAKEEASGDKRLVAYVVSQAPDHTALVSDIKAQLSKDLPAYMVPAAFVVLEAFPVSANGKIDKKALPQPDGSQVMGEYVAPQSDTETALVEIWAALLSIESERLSVTANFFELGGHSLLAVMLVAEIRQRLAVEVPIKALFDAPNVAALANLVDSLAAMKFVKQQQESAVVLSEGTL